MTRKRFTLDAHGDLVDAAGRVLGKLVGVSIDLSDEVVVWGVRGGVVDSSSTPSASASPPAQESLLPGGVQGGNPQPDEEIVWAHYERVIPGGQRFTLEAKRKRIIRNALAVRPLDRVLAAIDGLAASPHHNGQNDRGKKYLGIQYALAGKGDEGTDERIDKMAALAVRTVPDLIGNLPSAGREMVRDHMRKVAASLLSPGDENLRSRAEGSATYLETTFGLVAEVHDRAVKWSRTTSNA